VRDLPSQSVPKAVIPNVGYGGKADIEPSVVMTDERREQTNLRFHEHYGLNR